MTRIFVANSSFFATRFARQQLKRDCKKYVDGLWDIAKEFVAENGLEVKNMHLWNMARKFWEKRENKMHQQCLPTFYNNFEVSRVDFFQRDTVRKWSRRVSEEEPFGVFKGRWGDAAVRFLTMAIFATEEEIDRSKVTGYEHPCGGGDGV